MRLFSRHSARSESGDVPDRAHQSKLHRLISTIDTLGKRIDDRSWRTASRIQDLRAMIAPMGKTNTLFLLLTALGAGGRRRRAAKGLLALTLSGLAIGVIKPLVGRRRPSGARGSFPSGDTTAIAAAGTAVVSSPPGAAAAVLLTVGVATGRVLDRQHYPTDVLAGAVLGTTIGWLARRVAPRLPLASRELWTQLTLAAILPSLAGYLRRSSHRHRVELMVLLTPLVFYAISRRLATLDRRNRLPVWLGGTPTDESALGLVPDLDPAPDGGSIPVHGSSTARSVAPPLAADGRPKADPTLMVASVGTMVVWLLPWRHVRPLVTGMATTTAIATVEHRRHVRRRPRLARAASRLGLGLITVQALATAIFVGHWLHRGQVPASRIETKHNGDPDDRRPPARPSPRHHRHLAGRHGRDVPPHARRGRSRSRTGLARP